MTEELPAGWVRVELGSIADTQLGKMLDKGKSAGHERVPYLRNKNVQWGHIDLDDIFDMEMSKEDAAFYSVKRGDLLVCEGGEIGRCAVWEHHERIAFQKALHRVRPSEAVTAGYLRYFVEYVTFRGGLDGLTTGSTIKHLPQEQLRKLQILLPPVAEQHRIVAVLDEQLSRLDGAQASLRAGASRSRSAENSLLDAAVSGRLMPSTGESSEALLADLTRRRKARKPALSPAHLSGYVLPNGWRMTSLDALSWDAGYGTSTKCAYEAGGTPVLRIPNIKSGDISLEDLKRAVDPNADLTGLFVEAGDVLFVRTNGSLDLIGRAAVVRERLELAFASYLIRYRIVPDGVDPQWIRAVVSSPKWRGLIEAQAASSAGQHNVNLRTLGSLPIPVPPRLEQAAILDALEEKQRRLARLSQSSATVRRDADALRQSLLQAAFTGRLVPQDSNDEPASVLVERIRRERKASVSQKRPTSRAPRSAANRPAPAMVHPVPAGIQEELPL